MLSKVELSGALLCQVVQSDSRRQMFLKASTITTLLLALAVSSNAFADSANSTTSSSSGLQEITITAEKYRSTVQDTPISISAISGNQLMAAGIATVESAALEVPGISMRSAGPGQTEYEARGLASNGGAAPTVGFYLDDVPLSPAATSQNGKVVIDPDLYDINRIEVLRGPQGTLYGAGSMGGTVRVITNEPELRTFDASAQATLSNTQGGDLNGGGNAMLNIPIGDEAALRIVGSDSHRSGWINRVVLNPFPEDTSTTRGDVLHAPVQQVVPKVNTEDLNGGRASLLWKPDDQWSVNVMAFYQRLTMGGYDEFDSPPGAGYIAHYAAFNISEPISDTAQIYSAKISGNLGFADLTSETAYWKRQEAQTQDSSESLSYANGVYPYVSLPFTEKDTTRQFSQELRLSSRNAGRARWLVGGFYSDLNDVLYDYVANVYFGSPGNPAGIVGEFNNPYRIQQLAAFANGSYKITRSLKFSAGVRWFRYISRYRQQEWGYDTASLTVPAPAETRASNNGIIPRFDLSYSPNETLTTYLSASKGFRPGGANLLVPPPSVPPYCSAGAPTSFGPDTVWDYEVGEKTKLLGGRLSINGDVYYNDWSRIQEVLLLGCGYEYNDNAGNGRAFGPELEVGARLTPKWSVFAAPAYTDANVTHPSLALASMLVGSTSSCQAVSSCSLPILNVPKETASLTLVYTTTLMKDYGLTARVGDYFVGPSYDEAYYFGIPLPSYNIVNARVGVFGDKWSADLFADNVTDKVAELTANNTSFQVNIPTLIRYSTNQPRTYGLEVNYHY
jgi:iron complex outermembrane receptor protein